MIEAEFKAVVPKVINAEFEAIIPREKNLPVVNKELFVDTNGKYEVKADDGTVMTKVDVEVIVPSQVFETEDLFKEFVENGEYEYLPDADGYSKVKIKVNVNMDIIDSLLSNRTDAALSANQGKVLNEKKAEKIVVVEQSENTATIAPNVLNVWGEVATLYITLGEFKEGVVNEYMFQFTSGATATTLVLPADIKWVSAPNIQANKTYQVSIINNLGVIGEFSNE